MYCSNCGKKINAGTKFCPNCGASTGQVDVTASMESSLAKATSKIKDKKKTPKWAIIIAVILVVIFILIAALRDGSNNSRESDNVATEEVQNIELTEELNSDNAEKVSNTSEENSNEFNEVVNDNSSKVEDFTYYGGNYLGSIYYMEITMFTTVESDRYGVVFYFDNEGNENYYYLYSDDDAYKDWGYEYDYLFTFNDKDDVIYYLGMKNTSEGVTMDWMTLRATMDTLTMMEYRDPVEPYDLSELLLEFSQKSSPEIGMTKDEVINCAWGSPDDKYTYTSSLGTSEVWYWGKRAVYFKNDVVTMIQDSE